MFPHGEEERKKGDKKNNDRESIGTSKRTAERTAERIDRTDRADRRREWGVGKKLSAG